MENVFTFWEGVKPPYIDLCMRSWPFPYILLNYNNLGEYIRGFDSKKNIEKLKSFTLPMQADYIRAHVLRDNGGYWLDCDTIVCSDKLPDAFIFGDDVMRTNTIGFLHAPKDHTAIGLFFADWCEYQEAVLNDPNHSMMWNVMGNAFTDKYLKMHKAFDISPIEEHWPETFMVPGKASRIDQYQKFYFSDKWKLPELRSFNVETDIFMLHNSWTPGWYKQLSSDEVFAHSCTLSNILNSVLK